MLKGLHTLKLIKMNIKPFYDNNKHVLDMVYWNNLLEYTIISQNKKNYVLSSCQKDISKKYSFK